MQSIEELTIKCIRERTLLPEPRLNLKEALKQNNTESYLKLCTKRIEEADLIDGDTVIYDTSDINNLFITAYGIVFCKEILECYIELEQLQKCMMTLLSFREIYQNINNHAKYIMQLKRSMLKEISKDMEMEGIKSEYRESIRNIAKEELKARRIHNIVIRKTKQYLAKLRVIWYYRRLYLFLATHPNLQKER